MSHLQKMMASKYPSPSLRSSETPVREDNPVLSHKMVGVSLLLGVLFFILASPSTFDFTGSYFSSLTPSSLVGLHALLFALVSFILFKYTDFYTLSS